MNYYYQYNTLGQLHRDGGLPAAEWDNGDKYWYVNGQRHRDDGLPAIEYWGGDKEWWVNGKQHRDSDLPALENVNNLKEWWVNGNLHREGGLPAVEDIYNGNEWYIYGKKLSNEKGLAYFAFCQKMKEKNRIRAQKKIYFWWIQICYDLDHPSGCGKRMANLNFLKGNDG